MSNPHRRPRPDKRTADHHAAISSRPDRAVIRRASAPMDPPTTGRRDVDVKPPAIEGVVAHVNLDRGFGFIQRPGTPDVFFHVRDLAGGLQFDELLKRRRVKFNLRPMNDGRVKAVNIRPAD